uniref:Phosphatidylinositol transfer protein membrane associated 2 n=1 Tax=Hucho hucho TaxID=62062 RepID=A0A4W5QTQ3_9TELE
MLIKEYRIPMPMSVEEYRIAQLYMIQKKSREESCGEGSGVEILENKPYEDGPGGSGQYTHKVYHIGKHIPSWFCSILPQAALRVEEESWNAYPYTRTRIHYMAHCGLCPVLTVGLCVHPPDPIDIVKDYIAPHEYLVEEDPKLYVSVKTQRGPLTDDWIELINQNPTQNPVMCAYKLCKVEFRYWGMQSKIERFIHDVGLRKVMVRAHRQAWCWQDEWYGLTIEDIRQLELETQLALATKMAQYSLSDTEEGAGALRDGGEVEGGGAGLGDTLQTRGELTKQWSTSSRSSTRSSKRGGSPVHQNISEWRMQSIARDSEDSTDDEFFDAPEDFSGDEEMLLQAKEMNKWSSNDLMDKIETTETDEGQGRSTHTFRSSFRFQIFMSNLVLQKDGSSQQCLTPSKIHVLVLVLHGGNILDTGAGEPSSKQADVNTLSGAFETVMRVHYPAALGRIAIRMVPCPAVCADAFSQVSNLSPYSFDEGCLSNSQDHIPLAALPLLATSSPQYQDAVATVIQRANQVYGDFIRSLEGAYFSGQVCVIGDCVGGILGFDALCSSNVIVSESQNSSRRGSTASVQDTDLLSPDIIINSVSLSSPSSPTLEGSRHLSRSNIDIPRSSGPDEPKRMLPRKRSDSSTYELDTIKHHQAFLSSLHSSVLRTDPGSRHSSGSTMLEGGRLDFEVADFFLFGSPLGLVLALRKTVVPSIDVSSLRPACQQLYNLFHPADPSASRLEPLLEKRFHQLPPFCVPRYQRFPLGDGHSALLADVLHSHCGVFVDSQYPSSPLTGPPHSRGPRRSSEASIASQVSGMADSYTASNIANSQYDPSSLSDTPTQSRVTMMSPLTSRPLMSPQTCPLTSLMSPLIRLSPSLSLVASRWWGSKRMDFALYCPDALTAFPTVALPHLFHASYWESTDVVSFLLRQVMRHENSSILELDGKEVTEFKPSKPREKWLRKRTHVKIRNVTANHRVNDAVFTEDGTQLVMGRFMYGPLDMVTLTGEKIDIHIMTQPPSGEWVYFDTELTNSSGRISYVIPESKRLGIGVYPVKLVVRGDHTFADSYLTVLPRGTEFVVFSIDGSFAASVSIMGSDPKVRAGAVDVVRHWQDLGYLIVYVTGRPDMQKQRVVAWLSQHNFPHGIVSFCDGLVHDPLRHKANFLKALICEVQQKAKLDEQEQMYPYSWIFIPDGYASHLSQLEYSQRCRPAKTASARIVLRKGSFGLGAAGGDYLRKRNHILRSINPTGGAGSSSSGQPGRTERTLSQCEVEREKAGAGTQRSMSIAAGCWGRTGSTKEESGGLLSPK